MSDTTYQPSLAEEQAAVILAAKAEADRIYGDDVAAILQRKAAEQATAERTLADQLPPALQQELARAQQALQEAQIAYQAARQPPALTGDTRERALQRLEHEERQRDAQQALGAAQTQLASVQASVRSALQHAWRQLLSPAQAKLESLRTGASARRDAALRRYQQELAAIEGELADADREVQRILRMQPPS